MEQRAGGDGGGDPPGAAEPADPMARVAALESALAQERRARQAAEALAQRTTRRLSAALAHVEAEHRALRDLASAATHDIKNPLTSIVGFVHLLQARKLPDDVRDDVIGRLATSTAYMRELLDGLLDVLAAGVSEGAAEPLALEVLLAEVVADLQARHPDVVVHQRAAGVVLAPPRDARRLFDNLLENAARHGGRPDVTITVDRVGEGPDVVVRVADDGAGVLAADRDRIFAIYQRGSTAGPGSGSGIGLSVARRIAQAAHGDLWLDEAPGPAGGAAFVLRLPAAG